ncbi:ImmA/IrrE family metallo-endopeptidase [Glutamicibacter sp.]|uniref:ImmA/IrrE family metallo-endopeptidase n=1 Tax=Glutamicibacter sp. TaxID=1931995 RepID=UPI002FE32A0F
MRSEERARNEAALFRKTHNLGVQPLGDLVALIEQSTGIDVAVLDTPDGEHGMAIRDPDRDKIFIAVARSTKPMRQRSSLAHELAHVIFEDWGSEDFTRRSAEEIRADAFARHLLIPVEGLRQILGEMENVGEAELSDVVQRFLVSPALASIALREAGYINSAVASKWMQMTTPALATRFGWSDQYAALQQDSNRPRSPQKLLSRAVAGYVEGVVSAQAIATLRGLPVTQVARELDDAGIVPTLHEATDIALDEYPSGQSGLTSQGI